MLCIPIQVLELGEEIGWREYLLPKQIAEYGVRKGTLMNGLYLGIANLPLIYIGFNYSSENAGEPWSNMLMMMLVCVTMGIICSYVMVCSNNVMYTNYINGRDDWEFVSVYADEDITSCNTKKRDGFNKMVEDALVERIDLIITKSVSRFARNTVDSLTTIRRLRESGMECYFEKENIWTFDDKGEPSSPSCPRLHRKKAVPFWRTAPGDKESVLPTAR